jgi:hypothetical protein
VPENPNAGPSIADGPGELINRQSGLCLDVNASDPNYPGNGTTVDQWTCDGGANQQWSVGRRGSQYLLVSGLNNASDLGVGNGTCSPQGDGDKVYLQQSGFGLPSTSCDEWTITPASYDFATHPMTALKNEVGGGNVDNREYTCAPTDQFRQGMEVNLQDWGGALTAIGPVIVDAGDSRVQFDWTGSDAPDAVTTLAGSSFEYYQSTSTQYLDAQTMFYCDPQSGTL